MKHPLPFPRSYWAVPGRVLAGCYPGDFDPGKMRQKLEALAGAGVTRVINLMEGEERDRDGNRFHPYAEELARIGADAGREIRCDRFAVRDLSVPTPGLMREILDAVRDEVDAGGVVYIHCWGGKGRTGVVVASYLVEQGMSGEQALAELYVLTAHAREHFRETPQTPVQFDFVRAWKQQPKKLDRFAGALLGLAVGDAVGTTLEFKPPGSFTPLTDMVGGGPFHLSAGEWTDDTSMALCLATSLVEKKGFDDRDQMERYVRWWKEGYLSVKPHCFDIGGTVSTALRRFLETGDPYAGSTDPRSAGNGSLMRLAPIPLFYLATPGTAIDMAAESSRTTHGAATAVDACRYFAGLLVGAVRGVSKDELLAALYCPVSGLWDRAPLDPAIHEVASGSFKRKQPPEVRGTGYVVESLEAALWAFHSTNDFREGCLAAANLGQDADTTAAIYGQIAGAFYGAAAIPLEWRERVAKRELISELIDRLRAGPAVE